MNKAVFLDRDGTLIKEQNFLKDPKKIKPYPHIIKSLKLLKKNNFKLIMITNQSGIGRGFIKEEEVKNINKLIDEFLRKNGVVLDKIFYCPHHPDFLCRCRKPKLFFINKAKKLFNLNLKKSFSIGDRWSDVLIAKRSSGKGILLLTGYGKKEPKQINGITPDYIAKNFSDATKWILKSK